MSKESEGKALFNTLCQTLDNMKWRYDKDEKDLVVRTSAVGKDLSMKLNMHVDSERQVMYLKSPMPFAVQENVRDTVAKAAIIANYTMLNGSFEFDFDTGYLAFKMVIPYMESLISEKVCHYMVILSCNMTDKFNDKFQALSEGRLTLAEFESFAKS